MSDRVLAEFQDADALVSAAREARAAGWEMIDGYAPFPIDELADLLGETATGIRRAMFIGASAVAACAYALEWWSAVANYPINSGGRPLHSWPAFVMFPFSVGILSAAICGFIALLVRTGLPRLHHPLFAVAGFERTTQDRFALELALPEDETQRHRLRDSLNQAGAISVREVSR